MLTLSGIPFRHPGQASAGGPEPAFGRRRARPPDGLEAVPPQRRPHLALCLAPEWARTAAGFDYFSIYTIQHHTELDPDAVTVINDPRESAQRRERATAEQP
jgi:hypothetical protein